MKILKASIVEYKGKKVKTFSINDLTYIKNMQPLKEILNGENMIYPIEVVKHEISNTLRMGASGQSYIEKEYSLYKGSQRIQTAIKLGYTHIEGIIINE
jgi:hypothetical protein